MTRINQEDFNKMIVANGGDVKAICKELEQLGEHRMKITVPQGNLCTAETLEVTTNWGEVLFEVDSRQVEDRGWSGLSVAQLDIKNGDGLTARFFITVRSDAQGRPSVEVTAKMGGDRKDRRAMVKGKYCIPPTGKSE